MSLEKTFKKVLIICAHPDDETLGCGASISQFIENKTKVSVLILGEGSSARYAHNQIQQYAN